MAVELILLEDVENLGQMGDQVKVADGYARNYLVPKSKAAPLTKQNLRRLEARKLQMQKEHEERVAVARAMADKLGTLSITIPVQAAENDKLYGSVTGVQIAEAVAEQGINIDRNAILLAEPLRELGVYTVDVHLHTQVQTSLKVWIVRA